MVGSLFLKNYKQLGKNFWTMAGINSILKAGYVITSGLFLDYSSAFLLKRGDGKSLPITAVIGGLAILIEYKNDPRLYEALGLDHTNPNDIALWPF